MGMIGEQFEKVGENNRAKSQLFAILSGLMFGTGWWIIIGASANTEHGADLNGEYYLPGIFQVVSFLLINLISWEALDANNADQYSSPNVVVVNRAIFIFGIIIQLACLIFAVFIVVSDFADENSGKDPATGAMIVLSNVFLFGSTWFMRWGNIPVQYE